MLALPLAFSAARGADADLQALRDQIRALEQKLLVLERKQELKDEAAAAAAPSTPKITVNDKGFTLASADGANAIKLRGLVQLDARLFFGDGGAAAGLNNNAFVLRRARLITEGTFAKNYSFQLVPEFGGSSVSILDANLNVFLTKGLQFRLGKFKSPLGLEQLQSDSWTFFNERSIVTNLVPNRDLGIQAWGDLADNRVSYAVGVFNGLADAGSSTNTDFDNEKDIAARVTFSPFRNDAGSSLQGLTLGLAGSVGREKTVSGRPSGYRTDGQQTFFAYNSSVVSDGLNWRVSPQLDYRNGSFGLLSEYVGSTVNVRPSATGAKAELQNRAWQVAAGYVLTGEDSSYAGIVPRSNFDYAAGTWGAFEVTGRIARLDVDDAAFPLFASAASNANQATSSAVGLNWYLSKTVVLKLDYYQTHFSFNAAAPSVPSAAVLRQDEKAFIARFQLGF
ncbi:MAG TPA: porin [Acidobacteriota bacterium]|nr:porin [Acidobacteriota bacterium]